MGELSLFSAEKGIFEGSAEGLNFALNRGWDNTWHILAWVKFSTQNHLFCFNPYNLRRYELPR